MCVLCHLQRCHYEQNISKLSIHNNVDLPPLLSSLNIYIIATLLLMISKGIFLSIYLLLIAKHYLNNVDLKTWDAFDLCIFTLDYFKVK